MKIIVKFLIIILITSCVSEHSVFEDYANYPVKFAKQKITYPNNDFEIMIPHNWTWKAEQYEDDRIILGIDVISKPDENGFIHTISIQKTTGFSEKKDLKSEYKRIIGLQANVISPEIIDSRKTDFLGNSYFIHNKSDSGNYGELEMISILIEGNQKGIFYLLSANASQTEELKLNMAIMLSCLRTFNSKLEK